MTQSSCTLLLAICDHARIARRIDFQAGARLHGLRATDTQPAPVMAIVRPLGCELSDPVLLRIVP